MSDYLLRHVELEGDNGLAPTGMTVWFTADTPQGRMRVRLVVTSDVLVQPQLLWARVQAVLMTLESLASGQITQDDNGEWFITLPKVLQTDSSGTRKLVTFGYDPRVAEPPAQEKKP